MDQPYPLTRDLVLVGGGHTHALFLRMWAMRPLPGVRVTVINPKPAAAYSGMLPGFVAGHYARDELDIDLVRLARAANARLVLGAATSIDRENKLVHVNGRVPLAYDVASIDVGITSKMNELPGFAAHGTPAKPLEAFADRWAVVCEQPKDRKIAVIGGGIAGVELALAMQHRLRDSSPQVTIFDRSDALSAQTSKGSRITRKALAAANITLIENADIAKVASDRIILSDGTEHCADFVVGAAGATPHPWLSDIGVDHQEGFLSISRTLQTSDPDIFAVGDCNYMPFAPRPKAGVYAVRQAPVLHDNVRAALTGGAMRAFHPQKDYLKLVSLGDKIALAEKFGTAFVGPSLWSMKDSIDTKFMRQFDQVADMPSPPIATTVALGVREMLSQEPLCGGCGAKVGRAVLNEVIQTGAGAKLPEVTSIKGDDAAMIEVGGVGTVMTTDHLRAFANDPHLMTRIAVNHALGDVWAMGGKPKYVTMSLTLPRSNREIYQRTLHEVNHAASVGLAQAGAALVGGHTSIGSEFSIGFTVTGVLDGDPVTLAGAKPGDCLVLTKPIGSGVILAAEMRQLARGVDVASCYRQMLQGQGVAAKILAPDAHAMTDVTGFGLAGHLANINDASGTGTVLFGDAMPLMTGAKALFAMGVRSSLWLDNRQGSGEVFGEDHVNFALLFDPQTAGGLLASVDGQKADDLVKKLWVSGYPAAVIGQVTDETGVLRLT